MEFDNKPSMDCSNPLYLEWYNSIVDDDLDTAERILTEAHTEKETLLHGTFVFQVVELQHLMPNYRHAFDVRTPWCLCGAFLSRRVIQVLVECNVDFLKQECCGHNILHVLVTTAFMQPDLEKQISDFYFWLKTVLSKATLKTLLYQENNDGFRPLELSISLATHNLTSAIFRTEDVYLITWRAGIYEYTAFDISDYQATPGSRFVYSPLLLLCYIDRQKLCSTITEQLIEDEPMKSWIELKKSECLPKVIVWFCFRIMMTYCLLWFVETATYYSKAQQLPFSNETDYYQICPRVIQPTNGSMTEILITGTMLVFQALYIIFSDLHAILTKKKYVHLQSTPLGLKSINWFPFIFRLIQLLFGIIFLIYIILILSTNFEHDNLDALSFILSQLVYWQILYFCQLLPVLGLCIITLLQMLQNLAAISILIIFFICHQTFVFRTIITPCPDYLQDYSVAIVNFFSYLVDGFTPIYSPKFNYLESAWYMGTVILGSLLLMNFIIGIFADTVSQCATRRKVIFLLNNLSQYLIVEHFTLKLTSFNKWWSDRVYKPCKGRVYIPCERVNIARQRKA